MGERHEYPAGVPCWVDTSHPDPQAAAEFYGGLFGWEVVDRMPEDSHGHYFMATLRDLPVAAISSQPESAPPQAMWNTYVAVDDADATAAKVRDAGGSVIVEPFDVFDAGRMAVFADPEGAVFSVWQAGRMKGAEVINEHGAWNFSGVHVRDPEAAARFYAEVFGWDLGENGLLRLAGYGDFLEKLNPGMRAGMQEMGAPERFEDAVGWVLPLEDENAPPHWSVTFAVDDADATAARATELGGDVVMPPTDMPWVRTTVVRDPQGAVFTASKFVPPA